MYGVSGMSASDDATALVARCPFLAQLEQLPRLTEARYADGAGEVVSGVDPMEVAQRIFDQDGSIPNDMNVSALFTTWGQFIDHDLSLTPEGHDEIMENAAFPHGVGRSEVMDGTGEDGPREFGNAVTWQMDASMVYGSNAGREADLREFEGGRMRVTDDPGSDHDLLLQATPETVMAGDTEGPDAVYLAGDIRANENPNLLSLHTLFVREHNYWAERLAEEHPDWTDEQLYQGAREIVEFTIQQITYQEWLPLLIGETLPDDIDHDPDANGQVALEFSTAAFRFGHTMVASRLERLNEDGTEADGGHLGLMDSFFNVGIVREQGIDAILRGQAGQSAEELDTQVIDDLNFFLATPAGVSGFSLPALNLMRAGDHGMGSYVDVRAALLGDIDPETLDPTDFSIITSDPELQAQLAAVYGTVHSVDLWVGGLAEDNVDGTLMGPLFTFIISDQFLRTASADETFGQLSPDLGEDIIAEVRASSLDDVILRNTDIDSLQENPFLIETRVLTEALQITGTDAADTLDLSRLDIAGDVTTASGDDDVLLRGGSAVAGNVDLGDGNDRLTMTSGRVEGDILGGDGADRISISAQARVEGTIDTGAGDDRVTLAGHADAGAIETGDGADQVTIGPEATVSDISLGDGDDVARIAGPGVIRIDGGGGHDRLMVENGDIVHEGGGDGIISWDDGTSTRFTGFEVVTCFTPGTLIVTAAGKRPIEALRVGARVMTLDHGLQPIRWIGRTRVSALGPLAPVRIDTGALGNRRPLTVSPQHRLLLTSGLAEVLFGLDEVLAPALSLSDCPGVTRQTGGMVDYIHILFDAHEIVLSEGIPSESFHPGVVALSSLDEAAREEVMTLFPRLRHTSFGPDARPALRGREARLLAELMV
ncbi:Hint domain-containing protein [Jannaschia pohangensis]|uniref:Hint domain-containing protein n=2 Tax=Jannaschia pohangensis TaxID=390807 RepID=A0A1I3GKK8_9RHOB|nr:Hint domain-containing protein [Jannaschia pohangensis]